MTDPHYDDWDDYTEEQQFECQGCWEHVAWVNPISRNCCDCEDHNRYSDSYGEAYAR